MEQNMNKDCEGRPQARINVTENSARITMEVWIVLILKLLSIYILLDLVSPQAVPFQHHPPATYPPRHEKASSCDGRGPQRLR